MNAQAPTALESTPSPKDRLLLAASDLLDSGEGGEVSTRAICERAGVQAPTLYHRFGNKQELLDAVITHGFNRFLADRADQDPGDAEDPLDDIREGWNLHVSYGLENPNFYKRLYPRTVPGPPCGVVSQVEQMILRTLQSAAARGRLRVPPEQAAREILAASTGVVLTLIAQPSDAIDLSLSERVRDAILDRITTPVGREQSLAKRDAPLASAAISLSTALAQSPRALSEGETALMQEWLARLSAS